MIQPNSHPVISLSSVAIDTALQEAIATIAEHLVTALQAPLRAHIEASVQALVQEATRDIHVRIAAAIGQIPAIHIPLQLFPQPVQSVSSPAATPTTPTPTPTTPTPVPEPMPSDMPLEDDIQHIDDIAPPAKVAATTDEAALSHTVPTPSPPPQTTTTVVPAHQTEPWLPPVKSASSAPSKPLSITVVGLLPGQAHLIKNEFKFMKLHFLTSDAGHGKKLIALAKSNDYVVQMVDFIRHAVGDSVKSVSNNWVYVSGGMTKLRETLNELHNTHRSAMLQT